MNSKNRFICAMLVLNTSIMAGVPMHAQTSDEGIVTEDIHYTYDHASRLLDVTHSLNGGTPVVVASNSYDELGRLSGTERGVSPSLSSSYSYNVRSWITEIGGPLFGEILHYEDPRPGSSPGTPGLFGGGVSSMEWRASGDAGMRSYDFTYDGLGRLTSALYGENGSPVLGYGTSYSYDVMGNMLSLLRSGDRTPLRKGIVDNLSMTYEGNRLIRTEDVSVGSSVPGSMDFRDGADQAVEYSYDGNGNMTSDLNRGMTVSYNRGNQPAVVSYHGGAETFSYLPDGTKLSRTVTGSDSSASTTDYRGNLVYEGGVLKYVLFDGGLVSVGSQGSEYVFFLKDHLGSTRVAARSDGAVAQVNHYYPYGMSYAGNAMASRAELHPIGGDLEIGEEILPGVEEIGFLPLSGSVTQPYRFSGNELYLDNGLGLYDFRARQYDPSLGRFLSVDPLAEKYPGVSPYAYCAGNPVNFVDPFGRDTVNVSYANGKWGISTPLLSEGDDVFNIIVDGNTTSYTFSDGDYGSRMNVLNLTSDTNETFGVYHLSGTESVGYVIQPKGPATYASDGSRLKDGSYDTILGQGANWPSYVGLKNVQLYEGTGARVHYGQDKTWSTGCLLISSSYSVVNGIHRFDLNQSRNAVYEFAKYMGAVGRTENVTTPGVNNNPQRKRDRYTWGETSKIGKAKVNILTR